MVVLFLYYIALTLISWFQVRFLNIFTFILPNIFYFVNLYILWLFLNSTHFFDLIFSTSKVQVRHFWVVFVNTSQNITVKYILWKICLNVAFYAAKSNKSFALYRKCYSLLALLLCHHRFDSLYWDIPEYLLFKFAFTYSYFDVAIFT